MGELETGGPVKSSTVLFFPSPQMNKIDVKSDSIVIYYLRGGERKWMLIKLKICYRN